MTLIGYSLGGNKRTTNGINDYYNNIDYAEQMEIENLIYIDSNGKL